MNTSTPLPAGHVLVTPRHLAGPGDPTQVTDVLTRQHHWSAAQDPVYGHTVYRAPDQQLALVTAPFPHPAWRLYGAPDADGAPAWSGEFTRNVPAEILTDLLHALAAPHHPALPVDPVQALRNAGWSATGSHGTVRLTSPDHTASLLRETEAHDPRRRPDLLDGDGTDPGRSIHPPLGGVLHRGHPRPGGHRFRPCAHRSRTRPAGPGPPAAGRHPPRGTPHPRTVLRPAGPQLASLRAEKLHHPAVISVLRPRHGSTPPARLTATAPVNRTKSARRDQTATPAASVVSRHASTLQEDPLTSGPQHLPLNTETHDQLTLLGRALGLSTSDVIAHLLRAYAQPAPATPDGPDTVVPVYAIYQRTRIEGHFTLSTGALTIPAGPGAGHYKTASGAARAVVTALRPEISPIRTGWTFWRLAENGAYLETIRGTAAHRRTNSIPSALPATSAALARPRTR